MSERMFGSSQRKTAVADAAPEAGVEIELAGPGDEDGPGKVGAEDGCERRDGGGRSPCNCRFAGTYERASARSLAKRTGEAGKQEHR